MQAVPGLFYRPVYIASLFQTPLSRSRRGIEKNERETQEAQSRLASVLVRFFSRTRLPFPVFTNWEPGTEHYIAWRWRYSTTTKGDA